MTRTCLRTVLLSAALAASAPLAAQNTTADEVDAAQAVDAVEIATPPPVTQRNTVEAEPEPEPDVVAPPVAAPAPVPEPEIINPYANSYNDLLPLTEGEPTEAERERFNPLNLLGLLGLLGLFGLRRRDRVVYAERIDPVVRREDR